MRSILHDSSLSTQWLALVKEAQASLLINLEEELENYLVFLLIRFMNKPEIINQNISLNFLNCYHPGQQHYQQQQQLQAVGDQCLLFSGLFPKRSQRRGIKLSYIVKLGQIAYENLAFINPLYHHLSLKFTLLMDTLLALRGDKSPSIDLSQAFDLFRNTHSQYAHQLLKLSLKMVLLFKYFVL